MMSKFIFVFLFFLTLSLNSQDFRLYDWEALTSHRTIRDAVEDNDGNIWCASSGGILKYNYSSKEFEILDNVTGLSSVNYNAIEFISDLNIIIAGTNQGNIDLIFNDGSILNIYDIVNSNLSNKAINDIKYLNGKTYIGGSFGLTEFFPKVGGSVFEQTFGDSYRLVSVNEIRIFTGELYICTDQSGIQKIDINKNISNPKNWESITKENGFLSNSIKDVFLLNDKLYVAGHKKLYEQNGDMFNEIKSFDYDINGFFYYNDELYIDDLFGYRTINDQNGFSYFGNDTISSSIHNGVLIYNSNIMLLGEKEGLIEINNFSIFEKHIPNTNYSNAIFDMELDSKSNLWMTTGVNGFVKFDGNEWTYFNSFIKNKSGQNIPINSYKKIAINKNDDIYLGYRGTEGQVVMRNNNGEYDFVMYNELNSAFVGIDPTNPPSFFEAAETQIDRNGVAWTINWANYFPGPVLIAEDNGEFYAYDNCAGISSRGFFNLVIDNNGTKWLGADQSRDREGLVLYNENGTLEDKSDDYCLHIMTRDVPELVNNTITSLAVDKNGWVWAGTPTGITYFLNPGAIFYDNDPRSLVAVGPSVFLDFAVNHIYVDALNYKWISTTNGLYIYNSDATEQIAFINSDNSPIPSNDIRNVTINENTGEVYIATSLGLYKANSISIRAKEKYEIKCYPQPFMTGDGVLMTIEGLAGQSDIRITTSNGKLIRQIKAIGQKIFWDGKDESGNFVNSGVYLILASSGVDNIQSVSKIAVINKK